MNDTEAIQTAAGDRVVWDARVEGWRAGTRPDGRAVWVRPLMFTYAIVVGKPDDNWYDDRWCYERALDAISAAVTWSSSPDPEPTGWHRHPTTGRRRPDGDPEREYVEH